MTLKKLLWLVYITGGSSNLLTNDFYLVNTLTAACFSGAVAYSVCVLYIRYNGTEEGNSQLPKHLVTEVVARGFRET